MKINKIGQLSSSQNSRVVGTDCVSPAVTNGEKDGMPKIIERNTPMKGNYEEPRICTMVGRDPENPSSRQRSDRYEQMIELSDDVSNTLTSVQKDNLVAEPKIIQNSHGFNRGGQHKISPTITSSAFQENNIVAEPLRIRQATKQGYIEVEQGGVFFDATYPDSTTRRGRVQDGGNIAPTLMASGEAPCRYEGKIIKEVADNLKKIAQNARGEEIGVTINDKGSLRPHRMDKSKSGVSEFQVENENDTSSTLISARPNMTYGMTTHYRIRKLTPRECFRLMGVSETDIDKIQESGVSNSQQYKMAGNSIVVDVLYHIFNKMFCQTQNESGQLSLF